MDISAPQESDVRPDRKPLKEAAYRRFRPSLTLNQQRELHSLARRIQTVGDKEAEDLLNRSIAAIDKYCLSLLSSGLKRSDLNPTTRYSATLHILRDLLLQGWELHLDDEGILLHSPGGSLFKTQSSDPERHKEGLRRSFSFAREGQLVKSATSRFISSMEKRGIEMLFADGTQLADRLRRTTHGDEAIRPELELIEPGAKDPKTGLLLQDIWRYARHYWSIPYQSTPGRNVFYLVRDAALPARPLIGIAALGNPVLGSMPRDEFCNWSVSAFKRYVASRSSEEHTRIAAHLYETVLEGIDETYTEDLLSGGWQKDWRGTTERLKRIEQESSKERTKRLTSHNGHEDPENKKIKVAHSAVEQGCEESVDWQEIACTSLYRRKRAGALGGLVWAYGVLVQHRFSSKGGPLQELLHDQEGSRVVELVLRRIKQKVIASSVMELITCGALPPYREVLGGKLVAMLMLSREVSDDFEQRYSGRVSLIASALAGRPISRPASLAAITTSSLYPVGSSQYNRISVDTERVPIKYRRIGKTGSYGTVHFSSDTVETLGEVAYTARSNRHTGNNLFGEGASPKLRLVRSGLNALGLDSSTFLRHHSPRLLYQASLCSNVREVMLGLDLHPDYLLPAGRRSTEILVGEWRKRWLANRTKRPDVLQRLHDQTFDRVRLSRELADLNKTRPKLGRGITQEVHAASHGAKNAYTQTFVERLYRSSNSYADRLSPEELEAIHVDLGVDEHLLSQVRENRQVVVTGNPGDGKTHLIERLRADLQRRGAVVITDANACSDREILDSWRSCQREGKPLVLAINEWPLYVLQRLSREEGFAGVEEAIRQVSTARFYTEKQRPGPPRENVVVIDLSLRNLLAPPVIKRVIERLTQSQFYEGLNPKDPMHANRAALLDLRIRERLTDLLQFVAPQIGHVTMRQLVGFMAFLLTGGKAAEERLKSGQDAMAFAYFTLMFDGGEGPLFDAVRKVLDPARVTHPGWDHLLWVGGTKEQDWLNGKKPVGPLAFQESERKEVYRAIKRQFFFEHRNGDDLLRMVPEDEREFRTLLHSEEGAGQVRNLVLALNRFYEPDCSDQEREFLQLWQSHRFDVRAPVTFVTLFRLHHQQLRTSRVRLASWVEEWLPYPQQSRWSFALVANEASGEDIAMLEIDRDLYLTLLEAQRGLGRSSWSRTATRRITRFADQIHRAVEKKSGVEVVKVRNVETDLDGSFEITRVPARYRI